jgi:hypothetical protein
MLAGEHPICASGAGVVRATRTNGESALILRAHSARKMSALDEKCTSGMLPSDRPHSTLSRPPDEQETAMIFLW